MDAPGHGGMLPVPTALIDCSAKSLLRRAREGNLRQEGTKEKPSGVPDGL